MIWQVNSWTLSILRPSWMAVLESQNISELYVATCSWCPSPKKYARQKLFNTELCHSDLSEVPGSTVIPNSTPEQRLSTGNWSFGSHVLNLLKQCETSKPCKTGKGWKRRGDQSASYLTPWIFPRNLTVLQKQLCWQKHGPMLTPSLILCCQSW